jgi:peptidoglycan hydrolase CwlO-like protein
MSQIETIMLVALGFAVAALIALFLGRIAWVFALGLGKKRMQRAAPTTIAELQSDRDRLRAEYAMLSRKLELRMSDLRSRLAEQMAEVSRNRNRIDHLISELRTRDRLLTERDSELQALRVQIGPLESELTARTAAVQQFREQLRSRDEEIHKLTQTLEKLRAELTERNRQVAAMKKEIADREATGVLLHPDSLSAQERLRKRIDDLTSLSRHIETQRRHLVHQKSELETFKNAIDARPLRTAGTIAAEGMDLAPERQSDGPDADAGTLSSLDMNSRNLEQQLNAAERETAELENELKKLDETFNARLAELNIGIDNAVKLTGTLPVESIETSGLGEIAESPSAPEALAATDTVETLETVEAVEISPQEAILPPSAEALIEANGTEPHPAPQLSRSLRGVANVISLAARIRSQQKKAGD